MGEVDARFIADNSAELKLRGYWSGMSIRHVVRWCSMMAWARKLDASATVGAAVFQRRLAVQFFAEGVEALF